MLHLYTRWVANGVGLLLLLGIALVAWWRVA
jgi:hypothetical protein